MKSRIAIFEGVERYSLEDYKAMRRKYGKRRKGLRRANWFAQCVGAEIRENGVTFKQAVSACKRQPSKTS